MVRSQAKHALAAIAAACAIAAFGASAAPELIVNGGGEQPLQPGWTIVAGSARTTGLIRNDAGGVFAPDQGLGFIVVGPDLPSTITQSGTYPFGSERLVLRARIRTPGSAGVTLTLTGFNSSGLQDIQRSVQVSGLQAWGDVALTYAIPAGSRTWNLRVQSAAPGSFGVHADALTLVGTCEGDFNGDRLLNIFDIVTYLALYQAGDIQADLTGNGTIDFFDISRLLDSFEFICE